MKNYLIFGFAMALAGALLTLVMFFAGFHSDIEKMQSGLARALGFIGPTAIAVTAIVLGTRARRAEVPATEPFGYAQALGTGVMIALFAALFNLVFTYLYFAVINPDFSDIVYQAQVAAMEAKGMAAAQIESAAPMMRRMMSPAIMTAFGVIFGFFWAVLVSLVTAAFLKRSTVDSFADTPPALG
jgi:hypothetical protein